MKATPQEAEKAWKDWGAKLNWFQAAGAEKAIKEFKAAYRKALEEKLKDYQRNPLHTATFSNKVRCEEIIEQLELLETLTPEK